MKVSESVLLFLMLLVVDTFAQDVVHVPAGRPILMDGKVSAGEWTDAVVKPGPEGSRLLFKRTGEYALVAIQLPSAASGFVDLYISDGVQTLDLHASAKLGERALVGSKWPEWTWWNNMDWAANVARFSSVNDKRPAFLPTSNFEFQIALAKFRGIRWRLMSEINIAEGDSYRTVSFPLGAKNSLPDEHWLTLDFK